MDTKIEDPDWPPLPVLCRSSAGSDSIALRKQPASSVRTNGTAYVTLPRRTVVGRDSRRRFPCHSSAGLAQGPALIRLRSVV